MKQYFIKQFLFEDWANQLILKALRQAQAQGADDGRAQLLFAHLISSAVTLLQRVAEVPVTVQPFAERSLDECEAMMAKNKADWATYLQDADEEELERMYQFTFPVDGTQRRMSVADGITHLITHSAYHRGQIVARLKGVIDPLPLATYLPFVAEEVVNDMA